MKKSLKKNFLYNVLYQITIMVLPLITIPYVSRVLGADGVGTYSYTYCVAHYFWLFGKLGVDNYGNRGIARVRDSLEKRNEFFSELFSLQLINTMIALIAYVGYILLFSEKLLLYSFLQVFYVASALIDINWLFFGLEEFKITVTRNLTIKIINLVSIFVFIHAKNDLWKYVLLLSGGYFVAQVFLCLKAGKFIKFKFIIKRGFIRHYKEMLILFIPVIAISIYRMMDKIMIGKFCGMTQVGYYESAEKIITICTAIISSFGAVMMPRMSNMIANGEKEQSKKLFVDTMEIAVFIGAAIAFGIGAIADDFIPIFFGNGFLKSIVICRMLSSTVIFITWACIVRMLYLIPTEKNKTYIISVFLGAGVNLVINLLLIPRFASVGAAVGTITAEVLVASIQTISIRKELDIYSCFKKSIMFIIFGLVMLIFVRIVPIDVNGSVSALIMKIACGAAIYLGLSAIYFRVTQNRIFMDVYRKVLRRK